ncbi:MAG: Y-family DNA polymerase [Steroidobacteraceae bacterium]
MVAHTPDLFDGENIHRGPRAFAVVGHPTATPILKQAREAWLCVWLRGGVPDDDRLLQRLARWLTHLTPCVSLEPPQAVLAELRGSLKLFGGRQALSRRIGDHLLSEGLEASIAWAPTSRAACWLARTGGEWCLESPDQMPVVADELPVDCLGWPDEARSRLARIGVRTVAELVRLPREGLARRLGPALLAELDEGFGRRAQPRRRWLRPERFTASLDLPCESTDTGLIRLGLDRLLEQLAAFLRTRDAGVQALQLELCHRELPPTRLRLGLSRPAADMEHLAALWEERLTGLAQGAPVRALRLRSSPVLPLELRTAALPGHGPSSCGAGSPVRLLERLRARFGSASVYGLDCHAEHRPEHAWRVAEPLGRAAPLQSSKWSLPGHHRPLWLLTEPRRIGERNGVPRYAGQPLHLEEGPERIESGWWDGHDVRRDYYLARASSGARLWVYRCPGDDGGWWLHGVFG